jgi:hypothetical protein
MFGQEYDFELCREAVTAHPDMHFVMGNDLLSNGYVKYRTCLAPYTYDS